MKYLSYRTRLKYAMWIGLATIGVVLIFYLYFGIRHSRDPFGIENTIGKTFYADHSEAFGGYIIHNDFNQLTYLGSGVFEIDGIEYQITKGEWDGRGTRKYILTLDKKKVIEGASLIHVNVNKENEKINYDVWYRVYDKLFLTKF